MEVVVPLRLSRRITQELQVCVCPIKLDRAAVPLGLKAAVGMRDHEEGAQAAKSKQRLYYWEIPL